MKTREFIEKVERLDYTTNITKYSLCVLYHGNFVASVDLDEERLLIIDSGNFDFTKLCIEYAETPIAEREEEKKYTVLLPNPESYHNFALYKDSFYGVVIMPFNYRNWKKEKIYHLTEAEIKRNHEYLWQFAKEVEGYVNV